MRTTSRQSGFTAVELLITLFVAAAFLIAGYQLFNLVIKDGGATRAESRASNVAYDYLRKYAASSTTIPCTPSTPLNNADVTVDGLINTKITITVSCLPDAANSLSKVNVSLSYNTPSQTIQYSTYTSSSGSETSDVTDGLVAWFKLNGDATNSIGSANGTITNATSSPSKTGQADKAYSFNGSTAKIAIPSTFGLGANNTSISTWIYNPSATNHGAFVQVGTSYGYGIGMGNTATDSNGTKLIVHLASIRWAVTEANIGIGWHHIVLTIQNSMPFAYIDGGTADGVYPIGSGPLVPNNNLTSIGGLNETADHSFNGIIDDVRLYNRALEPTDVTKLYTAGPQ